MAARDGESDGRAPSDADLSRRLDSLSRELDAERQERAAAERPSRSDGGQYGYAFKLASEFVAGILVGAGLGWGLDRLAGTSPWGLIGLLLLGFVAGVANVVRAAGRVPTSASRADGGGAPL